LGSLLDFVKTFSFNKGYKLNSRSSLEIPVLSLNALKVAEPLEYSSKVSNNSS